MLPVKCNQHPWMKMYVNVVKNPFYAVTDKSGKYEIKGLPPGDYTIAFVHEKLGEQDQKVTVAPKETRRSIRPSKPAASKLPARVLQNVDLTRISGWQQSRSALRVASLL